MSESKAIRRLRAAMAPDPSRWHYTGISRDTGEYGRSRCACGHPVRYEFLIERDDGERLVIGSHCIETNVPYLISVGAERLARDLQEANREFQRERAAGRRRSANAEARRLLYHDFAALYDWCVRGRLELLGRRVPVEQLPDPLREELRRPYLGETVETTDAIRRRYVEVWWEGVEVARVWEGIDMPPIPEERQLRAQVRRAIERNGANPDARLHEAAVFAAATH